MSVADIIATAQIGASRRIARAAIIKIQIERCQRKLAGLSSELYEIEPPAWSERFGDSLGTIAAGIAGREA